MGEQVQALLKIKANSSDLAPRIGFRSPRREAPPPNLKIISLSWEAAAGTARTAGGDPTSYYKKCATFPFSKNTNTFTFAEICESTPTHYHIATIRARARTPLSYCLSLDNLLRLQLKWPEFHKYNSDSLRLPDYEYVIMFLNSIRTFIFGLVN